MLICINKDWSKGPYTPVIGVDVPDYGEQVTHLDDCPYNDNFIVLAEYPISKNGRVNYFHKRHFTSSEEFNKQLTEELVNSISKPQVLEYN